MSSSLIVEEIKKRYQKLYRDLKANVPELLEEKRVPPDIKEQILTVVSNLPHPSVASLIDIRDVCQICRAVVLEYLYRYFGEEVEKLCRMVSEVLEEVRPLLGPPHPERSYNLQSIGTMLEWTNRSIYHIHLMVGQILSRTDITLKGQCPYCGGDLVEFIDLGKNELRIQCKNKPTPQCSKAIWVLHSVTKP